MAEYKKPFKDWTLGELKEYCVSVVGKLACQNGDCPFKKICDRITENCVDEIVPGDWDLSDKPRFNEQDKADAKALLRVFPWASKVVRYGHELQARAVPTDGRIVDIAYEMFPSVPVGHPEFLNTILHEGEVEEPMTEYIEREAADAEGIEKLKIKTHFAQIIVGNKTAEKPYFSILYYDPTDRDYHIGFSSFCLDYVFKWLAEEFEIVEGAADVVEVVHGRWLEYIDQDEFWGAMEFSKCSICGTLHYNEYNYCPNCGAKMDGERKETE